MNERSITFGQQRDRVMVEGVGSQPPNRVRILVVDVCVRFCTCLIAVSLFLTQY